MYAKINPYLRPLLDALYEMMSYEQVRQSMERDSIEVAPLAYMRGRTLNEAFIILDEAQNTTVAQMKMFLTRMGQGSRIVVAGDITQVDLPPHTQSGMSDAIGRLRNIDGVCHIRLTKSDIVRHRLVHEIVQAYEEGRKKRR
jgi:phosphate starvation-inducible PhoH-like protein